MRIYQNLYEATKETQRDLHEMGTVVQLKTYQNIDVSGNELRNTTKEITGHTFRIEDPFDLEGVDKAYELVFPDLQIREAHRRWIISEYNERMDHLGNVNPGDAWLIRKETWKDLFSKNDPNRFDYTYNERIHIENQLHRILDALHTDLFSRRCVLQIYQYDKDLTGIEETKRVPCSVDYSWLYRDGKLNIFYHMRSSDFYEHFLNDMVLASWLNRWMAKQLEVKPGALVVYINSLHAYKINLDERKIF
jgi:thymidylate synthase